MFCGNNNAETMKNGYYIFIIVHFNPGDSISSGDSDGIRSTWLTQIRDKCFLLSWIALISAFVLAIAIYVSKFYTLYI